MRVVLQRVSRASVTVAGRVTGSIGKGLLVLAGFAPTDGEPQLVWMADKILGLRVFSDADDKMSRALDALERELAAIRTGRAATALVERIAVEYYGTSTPLNQLASISVPEAHSIVIQPWDRSALGAIEKAILKSEVGLTPNVDGTVVRLNIPPLTEERRKDLVKLVHKRMEDARVEIRNHRRDIADELKKAERDGDVSVDEGRREMDALQKATDRWIAEVDRVGKHKEQEILDVG